MTSFAPQSFNTDRFQPFKKKKVEDTTTTFPQPIQTLSNGGLKYNNGTTTPPVDPYAAYKQPTVPDKKPVVQPTASDNYLSETSKIALEEQKFLEDRAKSEEAMANRIYDRKIKTAQDMAPLAQQGYDQFKTDTTAGATTAKANAEETWGNDQRLLAQTRQETAGRLGAKFAVQNTSDSFGAGSAKEANTNLESDFNRSTAQGLRQKSQNVTDIDQKANSLIAQEGIKLKQSLLQIQNTIFDSEDQKATAISKAYDDAKAGIMGIRDNLANMKYQKALSDEQIAKTGETAGLSAGFIKTGTPETAADFVFRMKNPTGFKDFGTGDTNNAEKNQITSLVTDLLTNNRIDQVYGWNRVKAGNFIPGTSQQITRAKNDQLKAMISLENAAKLKGQGSITENERRLLADASTVLNNPMISPEDARNELLKIQQSLGNGQNLNTNSIQVGRFTISQ